MKKKIIICCGIVALFIVSCVSVFFIIKLSDKSPKETGFTVSINNEVVTSTTKIEVDYSPTNQNDWKSKVSVKSDYSDGSSVDLKSSDYTFVDVPAVLNANEEGYTIGVKYKSFPACYFKLIVNRQKVTRPTKNDDVNYVYNGSNYEVTSVNADLYNEAYYLDETSDDYIQKNAGVYTTIFVLNPNYKWATMFSGSNEAPQILQWSIKKKEVTRPTKNDDVNYVYNGSNYEVTSVNADLYGVAYYLDNTSDNFVQKNAGVYTTIFVLNSNYKWATVFSGSNEAPQILQWSIKKQEVDIPTIPDSVYTGSNLPPVLTSAEKYIISSTQNYSEYVDIGVYNIKVELLDKVNYKWKNGTSDDITVEYKIY